MLASILLLILLLPVAFLSSTLESLFSPNELAEMGIRLDSSLESMTGDPVQTI